VAEKEGAASRASKNGELVIKARAGAPSS